MVNYHISVWVVLPAKKYKVNTKFAFYLLLQFLAVGTHITVFLKHSPQLPASCLVKLHLMELAAYISISNLCLNRSVTFDIYNIVLFINLIPH